MLFGDSMHKLVVLFALLILLPAVEAVLIEVEVPGILDGRFNTIKHTNKEGLVKIDAEFYNTGSIPYKVRIRVDVYNQTESIFTGWSKEKILAPGDRKVFTVYYYSNLTGNFTAKVRAYYGNEIKEEVVSLEKAYATAKNVFKIENFRAYENFAAFDVLVTEATGNAVVIPSDFPSTWVVEQESLGSMQKGQKKTVFMRYKPDVWVEDSIRITVVSEDGMYIGESMFKLKKASGILELLGYLLDMHRLLVDRFVGILF
jgi:hypothetical protein